METATVEKLKLAVRLSQVWLLPVIAIVSSWCTIQPVVIIKDDILIEGKVAEYSKIADSGNERIQGFCGTCGCQLYARAPDKSVFNVRTGFLKQHHILTPVKHIFGQSKAAWIETIFEGKWHVAGPDSDDMKP